MKTSVKALFATALTAIVLSTSAFSANAAEPIRTELNLQQRINFNKVVVKGNVQVEVIQSNKQGVVVYGKYDKAVTRIEAKGDKLFISSNEDEPLHMVVYMKDLQRIDASNAASVTTKGKFSLSVLQVFLKDTAKADVIGNIGSLYTYVEGNSTLKLKGTAADHNMFKGRMSQVKMEGLAAVKTKITELDTAFAASR
ncbi:opacity protein-like surface antigen [Pedobacter africanus]|uniref:Opacity protein-like surface antigen n=1 Tax=Pedobacter africanus TaxID=151894 RepID=A0ACC6KWJ6_9SPHI|nr:DUF2807 domain-containing protein [Pedobacter africanus]MDR6783714.1 opacity protein-like surface antigen [Pedobacter africanus]